MKFKVGDRVWKVGGDYEFEGEVVAAFRKRNGMAVRYVVEEDRGILFIFSDKNLETAAMVRASCPECGEPGRYDGGGYSRLGCTCCGHVPKPEVD